MEGLSLLGLLLVICIAMTQFLLFPIKFVEAFHVSSPLGLGNLQTWIGVGVLLLVGAWLLGDR